MLTDKKKSALRHVRNDRLLLRQILKYLTKRFLAQAFPQSLKPAFGQPHRQVITSSIFQQPN